jgi:hypothetical protein
MASGEAALRDLTLLQPDGSPVRLGDVHAGPVLVVFLRHLT